MNTVTSTRYPKLGEILDIRKLAEHVKNGYVNVQTHKFLPLEIYNYSHLAQFEKDIWGDGVIDYCRGLIIDAHCNVIARPFKKFWNLNTAHAPESMEENLPKVEPTVLEKLDGSLGILYRYENYTGIATRGSFHSPQAEWANGFMERNEYNLRLPEDYTPLFEIIYDENRIVCKYDYEGLTLLGFVHKATGYEMEHGAAREIAMTNGLRIVEDHAGKTLEDLLLSEAQENREGYVVSYHTGPLTPPVKVKVKFEEYVRLHRVVTGMNPKAVWEMMSTGQSLAPLYAGTPKHFQEWLTNWELKLVHQWDEIYYRTAEVYKNRPFQGVERDYRKACALYFQKEAPDLTGVLFARLDGKNFALVIWKMIKPKCNQQDTFRKDGE